MYKAIVSDLDGTLLNENHKVSPYTRETIKLLLKKGIKFYIATGRSYLGAKEVMEEIGLKIPLITSNGTRILDESGAEIYVNNLARKYVEKLIAMTDFDNPVSLRRFERAWKFMGLDKLLKKEGIQEGDTVNLYGVEFSFSDKKGCSDIPGESEGKSC